MELEFVEHACAERELRDTRAVDEHVPRARRLLREGHDADDVIEIAPPA